MPDTTPGNGRDRQIAFVFDLNKCIGCQTCSVACKVLWHQDDDGAANQWWCSVNTLPGRGTPRDWEAMGGGFDARGKPVLGELPTPQQFGDASAYNYEEVYSSANRQQFQPREGKHHPEFGTEPNVFYVPPLSPFRVQPDGRIDQGQRRIPPDHLESQFGPGVGEAIQKLESEMAKRQRGEPSELMDVLIGYRWEEFLGPFTRDPAEITW